MEDSRNLLLFKKGDCTNISNYRPIRLTSNVCKIFNKLLKNRMHNSLDAAQGAEQAGFCRNHSTVDYIFTINQLIEKSNEYNLGLHILFIDYEKAFDSVNLKYLWKALKRQGIQAKFIRILQEMYDKSKVYIKLDKVGPTFDIIRGVKQGTHYHQIYLTV